MIVVYSAVRSYRSSCGVVSPIATRSFLNPPASMFRSTARPWRNASDVIIFAAVYGCMAIGCTATSGRMRSVRSMIVCATNHGSTNWLSVYTSMP